MQFSITHCQDTNYNYQLREEPLALTVELGTYSNFDRIVWEHDGLSQMPTFS